MRSALKTFLLVLVVGVPTIAVGLLSDGAYASRVLQGGIVLVALGSLGALWELRKGKRADREQDERAEFILAKSLKFNFLMTAVALQTYWAWNFARTGNAGDTVFIVYQVFWFSFIGAYVYNTVRT